MRQGRAKPRRRLGRRLPKRPDRLLPDAGRIRRVTSHSKGRRTAALLLRSRMLLLNTVLIKRARHNLIHALLAQLHLLCGLPAGFVVCCLEAVVCSDLQRNR